ncbi:MULTISPECIES: ATP-grasp domain-containing protein [Bacteroides]|uniref:ATP-grasp domain-containing protein n=1 Tax=Bacteroides TaxID=816 RepID=UPI000E438824|nr:MULTISPECIES: ATP-grasp domain-containing protein [Bacteroides]MBS7575788.1 ATP-grasp domain-containing protein [Bacteroides propionicigenes]RGM27119.1 ATP-grasp domain-containing protein [Bacteroides sp. OM08-17BH]HBO05952.1 biotin carboxylase [Bacteroides sp.]
MNNQYNGHLCIVFALEHYNPLNMIRALGENGINPVYISVKRRYEVATKSKYISKLHRVDSVEDGFRLLMKQYGHLVEETGKKPYIVFSDDKSVGYFDLHYNEWKDKFIAYNAGCTGRINEFMDKYEIQQLAKKYGFNVLDSYVISKKDELPEHLWYPIITKDISPNSGSWKSDVYICQSEQELREAIVKIESPLIMIQHFVDKQNEMALEGYCINKGKEMQIVTEMKWKYLIQGYYSPYHDVKMFEDKEMEKKLQAMFEEIGFEGVFEVEFLIDKDGTYYFMETNFRASAWNPTGKFAGMPLPYLWIKGMENGCIDPADRKEFEPFTSMSEVIDYAKRVEGGMCSLPEWLREFKDAKCVYIYDKEDCGPWDEVIKNWENFK